MEWLKRFFATRQRPDSDTEAGSLRRVTLRNPLVIESPRIGFFNLLGASARPILEKDKAALGPLFASLEESDANPPVCAVLMIYARLERDGGVDGCSEGLRDIIRKSRAPIVIVASENNGENYIAGGKQTGYGQANLVMTLKRKGDDFTTFFAHLFRKMFDGKSMPLAWAELAPQSPREAHANCPETIFSAEVSHIIFK